MPPSTDVMTSSGAGLAISSDTLRRVVDSSRYGIVITDPTRPDNPIVYANPAFSELTGYAPAEVAGRNCRFLQQAPQATPGENTEALAVVRDAVAHGRHAVVILRNYRKDGSAFWNELSVFPILDVTGRPALIVGQQVDVSRRVHLEAEITRGQRDLAQRVATRTAELRVANERLYDEILERRKAERALRTAERKFRSIFEHAVVGIYQSSPDGRYLAVNPALARLYGFTSPADMLARIGDIAQEIYVDPSMRRRFRELIERDGVVQNLEYQVRRRDGTVFWISESARVARDRHERVLYYEGMILDIQARKHAEAEAARFEHQLQHAQKMEAIGTLAGGIAHDFNNILGAIIGNMEMALDDVPADSVPARLVSDTLKAAQRAKQLVRQILAFSRREKPRREPVQLRTLIDEAVTLLRATLPTQIRIETDFRTGADEAIADPGQMHQVLVNLGTNAAHAMREHGGTLTMLLDRPSPATPPPLGLRAGQYLRLAVSDTGHGMPDEVLQRLFEPFFTTKPIGEGTGLGLPVVHGIIGSHGGAILVDSTPGAGSTFTIWLPAAPALPPTAPG